jgi:hypothetical protein
VTRFALAPMSRLIYWLTALLIALPAVLAVVALGEGAAKQRVLLWTALAVAAGYVAVWLAWRPAAFEVDPHALVIRFPLRQLQIPRHDVVAARRVDPSGLRERYGLALRVGVGGLWGVFGWLWTRRRGFIDVYASRADGLVLLERRSARDLLITPERPDEFVAALS